MRTDRSILRIARSIDAYQQKIRDLIQRIKTSDHPHAQEMAQWLHDNQFGHGASAVHCVYTHFSHPEKWNSDGADIAEKKNVL